MLKQKILLVVGTLAITFGCIFFMNNKNSVLSNYAYDDNNVKYVLKLFLDKDDLKYVVDNQINPDKFMEYIYHPEFNIHYVNEYNDARIYLWYLSREDSMREVNQLHVTVGNQAPEYLKLFGTYSYETVWDYIYNGDKYIENAILIHNPGEVKNELQGHMTIKDYKPYSLVEINGYKCSSDIYESLNNLLISVNSDRPVLSIINAYLSYDELVKLNEEGFFVIPGQNYHQLGKAVDLAVDPEFEDFDNLYKTIREYGFEIEECSLVELHIRYVR